MNRRKFLLSSGSIVGGSVLGSTYITTQPTIATSTNLESPSSIQTVSSDITFTVDQFDLEVNNISGTKNVTVEYSLVHNQVELRTIKQSFGPVSGSGSFRTSQEKLELRDFDLVKGTNGYKLRIRIQVGTGSTATTAVTESQQFDVDCSTGGVARYTMNSDSVNSGTLVDAWGNNDGTINGATNAGSPVENRGKALSFDGTNDGITISSSILSSDVGTVTMWSYYDSISMGNSQYLFDSEGSNRYLLQADGNGNLDWFVGDTTKVCSSSIPNSNLWFFVIATYDHNSNNYELFIDGVSEDVDGTLVPNSSPSEFYIGRKQDNNNHISGDIDDVRIYDRVLSSGEITDLYNGTKP